MALPYVTTNEVVKISKEVAKEVVKESPAGTKVVANPTLSGSEEDLTGLQVGDIKYKVPAGGGSGTDVEANPELVGDEDALTSIKIGDTKYKIEGDSASELPIISFSINSWGDCIFQPNPVDNPDDWEKLIHCIESSENGELQISMSYAGNTLEYVCSADIWIDENSDESTVLGVEIGDAGSLYLVYNKSTQEIEYDLISFYKPACDRYISFNGNYVDEDNLILPLNSEFLYDSSLCQERVRTLSNIGYLLLNVGYTAGRDSDRLIFHAEAEFEAIYNDSEDVEALNVTLHTCTGDFKFSYIPNPEALEDEPKWIVDVNSTVIPSIGGSGEDSGDFLTTFSSALNNTAIAILNNVTGECLDHGDTTGENLYYLNHDSSLYFTATGGYLYIDAHDIIGYGIDNLAFYDSDNGDDISNQFDYYFVGRENDFYVIFIRYHWDSSCRFDLELGSIQPPG